MAFLTDEAGNVIGGLTAGRNAVKRTVVFDAYEHGADPTGILPNDDALIRALNEVAAIPGHAELIIPNVGGANGDSVYSFATGMSGYSPYMMEKDFTMTWEQGALFKGAPDISSDVMVLRGGTETATGQFTWVFNNPQVDMSLGNYASGQPSFCSPQFVRECYVNEGHYYGGPGWWLGNTIGGDSAWEPIGVTLFESRGGFYYGWNDAAFYCGGANNQASTDDGFECKIIDPKIFNCSQGATLKRAGRLMTMVNPTIHQCYIGITSLEVGPGQEQDAGKRIIVQGGIITKCVTAVRVRGQTLLNMDGTVIEDWGRNPAGVLQVYPWSRAAIHIQGALRPRINNVTMRFKEWSPDKSVGIATSHAYLLDQKMYYGGNGSGSGNSFEGVMEPIYDQESDYVFPSYWQGNHVSGPITYDTVKNGTSFEYQQTQNSRKLKIVGNSNNVGVRSEILTQPF